ncbi:MAG: DUF5698 domain-containing protein [bacterium]
MDGTQTLSLFSASPWLATAMIFFARVVDVTLGTIRIIMVARGDRWVAVVLGFFEVLIWLAVIGQIMNHLTGIQHYLGYAAGFAAGNYVGMTIEQRLSMATVLIRIVIPREHAEELWTLLFDQGYRLTRMEAEGSRRPVTIIFSILRRSHVAEVVKLVRQFDGRAFYTIENVRTAQQPIPNKHAWIHRTHLLQPFYWFRKGK